MGLLAVSAKTSAEILAVIDGLRGAEKEWRKVIRTETRTVAGKEWSAALERRSAGVRTIDRRILVTSARVKVSDQNVLLTSATVGRRLSGGLDPRVSWAGYEFGANRDSFESYTATSKHGKRFTVRRRTKRALPARVKSGRIVYPAAAEVIPRIAALWAQTVARTLHEAFESR